MLEVVEIEPSGVARQVSSRTPSRPGKNVTIVAGGGQPGCCAFVYGTATSDIATVSVFASGLSSKAAVSHGTWLVVLETSDIEPSQTQWEMRDDQGLLVDSGRGPITAP
jgi:NAD(P)H-hydrate repair Nnr-like enzyme with NAD(P)H-hydrate epimerase domain